MFAKNQKWFDKKYPEKKETLTELKISDKVFDKSLKINGFTKLETIDLKKFKLTSLEISNCSQLTEISLSELTSSNLMISKCSELNEAKLSECRIKNLSVSVCPKLTKLYCELDQSQNLKSENKLNIINLSTPNLEISSCAKLNEDIKLSGCQIKNLSVNECRKLDCSSSGLTEIEISNLTELDCS